MHRRYGRVTAVRPLLTLRRAKSCTAVWAAQSAPPPHTATRRRSLPSAARTSQSALTVRKLKYYLSGQNVNTTNHVLILLSIVYIYVHIFRENSPELSPSSHVVANSQLCFSSLSIDQHLRYNNLGQLT